MGENDNYKTLLDMYIFETSQFIDQLEQLIMNGENTDFSSVIHEIFRIMHTIKGSSAMMNFNDVAKLSHAVEDLFYYIRENNPKNLDTKSLSDIILGCIDFIKNELFKIESGKIELEDSSEKIEEINKFLSGLKNLKRVNISLEAIESTLVKDNDSKDNENTYEITIHFTEGCEMENVRAFSVIHQVSQAISEIKYKPEELFDQENEAIEQIKKNGFKIMLVSNLNKEGVHNLFKECLFISQIDIKIQTNEELSIKEPVSTISKVDINEEQKNINLPQNGGIISVNIEKTDRLMNLIGELIISEAMVTQNPDLRGLDLENFSKAARQLNKITSELQDVVMSIRMVPLMATFYKMQRIVRDMSSKMNKDVNLKIIGEETEVDKSIIEHISDPLMHLVRNAIDHGIEELGERIKSEKPRIGTVTLEAKNSGSDVLVIIKDDGKGLNKEKILKKALEKGITDLSKDLTDKEIFNLILLPGFSTKDNITEFSGRGVGMDVVARNIEAIGGSVTVDSEEGIGSTITLKIPLTLAIIDGMNVEVGDARYTLPTIAIKESFRPKESDIIIDPRGNEMIMVRGECYRILRLHELFNIHTEITAFHEGIIIMVEQNSESFCIFADQLLGQQQVVIKALPNYIKNTKTIGGLAGCTLLGDGSISLILNVGGLTNMKSLKLSSVS
ncbi:MAG: chemotaxis protein CheA [Firmicutes bacterium HGW-Firmicutes-1]|nr:MAG: chemotaxis protein CheA [Firmicutes bacterium HGW-Firmicutes-1]